MDAYVIYNELYQVLICCQHHYAISPDSIVRHFRMLHKSIPLEMRQRIIKYASELDLLEPKKVSVPTQMTPIKGLAIYDGFKCTYNGCTELRGTVESMRKHCHTHGWVISDGIKWSEQKLQTFFTTNNTKYVHFYLF
jgi:hypothetical protein